MAIKDTQTTESGFSAQRRFQIGANVAIAIAGAIVLTVLVNWFASIKQVRKDLSTFARYGLSPRTREILNEAKGEVRLSMLYSPDDASKDPTRYIDRLGDYLEELRLAAPNIRVDMIRTHTSRAELVKRVAETFGGETEKHAAAIKNFRGFVNEMKQGIAKQLETGGAIQSQRKAWLNAFPSYADVLSMLRDEQEKLDKAMEQVETFVSGSGVPKYDAATERVKTDLNTFKTQLVQVQRRLDEIARLADSVAKPDSEALKPLQQIAATLPPMVSALRQIIGDRSAPMPEDPKATLKQFADEGEKTDKEIQKAVRAVEAIARQHKAIAEHANWSIQAPLFGGMMMQLPLTRVLSEVGKNFGDLRLQILGIIDRGDKAGMERAIKQLRGFTAQLEESVKSAGESLGELANDIVNLDPASKVVLDEARNNGFMKPQVEALEKLTKELAGLPELKIGTIADDIKEDNVVVVEAGKKVRVIKFDEVWPIRQVINDPSIQGEEQQRVFNGDTAISAAILGLTRDKPFATIVLAKFEPKVDQRQQMFVRPPPPAIPVEQLSILRKRLEDSNFKVVEWDLTGTDAPPAPAEGTESIYVFLPPAPPSPPNPFGGAPPGKPFGPEELKRVEDALAKPNAKAVFLVSWDVIPSGPFGGGLTSPKYALNDLLQSQFGVSVDGQYRITWIVPDNRKPDQIAVSPERFQLMPANYFTDQPIGKSFQTNPVKLMDACPLRLVPTPPTGVTIQPIMKIPAQEEFIGADVRDLIQIVNAINDPASGGLVPRSPTALSGPFDVMVAAKKDNGASVVVFSAGRSLSDMVMARPMLKQVGEKLVSEPPPATNPELFVNSLYWLLGQPQWIGSGPPRTPSIRPIESDKMALLRVVTYGLWPAAVFAPGLFIWFARRR